MWKEEHERFFNQGGEREMKARPPNSAAKIWIKWADEDLEDAVRLYESKGTFRNILLHVEQSIEKYLKAFLIWREGRSEYEFNHNHITHNIKILRNECSEYDEDFKDFIDDFKANVFTYFATSGRYPDGRYQLSRYPTETELPKFFEIAEKTKNLVLQKLETKEEVVEKKGKR
ncbi:MAG: HEPN domain-containing protein [bacterium JZ-2024 1]